MEQKSYRSTSNRLKVMTKKLYLKCIGRIRKKVRFLLKKVAEIFA